MSESFLQRLVSGPRLIGELLLMVTEMLSCKTLQVVMSLAYNFVVPDFLYINWIVESVDETMFANELSIVHFIGVPHFADLIPVYSSVSFCKQAKAFPITFSVSQPAVSMQGAEQGLSKHNEVFLKPLIPVRVKTLNGGVNVMLVSVGQANELDWMEAITKSPGALVVVHPAVFPKVSVLSK